MRTEPSTKIAATQSVPILIVTAFGRALPLAYQLQSRGMGKVLVLDVGDSLGGSDRASNLPEDEKGPFGRFYTVLDKEWNGGDATPESHQKFGAICPGGWTLWTRQYGPLELRGALTAYQFQKRGISLETESYLKSYSLSDSKEKLKLVLKRIENMNFEAKKVALLAHSLASPFFTFPMDSLGTPLPLPLFEPYGPSNIFYPSRDPNRDLARDPARDQPCDSVGDQEEDSFLQGEYSDPIWNSFVQKGGQIIESAQLVDLVMSGSDHVRGIEIRRQGTEASELIASELMIWALRGEETAFLGTSLVKKLFPKGFLWPEWDWVRYRLRLKESHESRLLPKSFAILEDEENSWSHENLICVHSVEASPSLWDFWIRIPTVQKFHKPYLSGKGQRILEVLRKLFHQTEIQLVDYPSSFARSYTQVGPSRFPLMNEKNYKTWKTKKWKNLLYASGDQMLSLSAEGRWVLFHEVFQDISKWWKKRQDRIERDQRRKEKMRND